MVYTKHILLADDDQDDTTLFQDVLDELALPIHLAIIRNGQQLLQFLIETQEQLPDILFMDLNMPRRNGFECLSKIKSTEKLKNLPVIIFTTTYDAEIASRLYRGGAQYYIRKPNKYEQLKKVIDLAISLSEKTGISQPPMKQFVISSPSQHHKNK